MMELFTKIVNGYKPFTIFAKSTTVNVWQGFKHRRKLSKCRTSIFDSPSNNTSRTWSDDFSMIRCWCKNLGDNILPDSFKNFFEKERKFSVRILVEIERKFRERKALSMIKSTLIFWKKEQELSHCKNYKNFYFLIQTNKQNKKQKNKQKIWMYLNALASHWSQNRRYFVEKLHHR